MSIDFEAKYGIGYKICERIPSESPLRAKMPYGLFDYVEENINDGFEVFQTNKGYDTESDAIYIVVDYPFSNGLDLTNAKSRIDAELRRLGLEPDGEFNLFGGLYVW